MTLDRIMKDYKIDSIDIEGAEKEVFHDSFSWIDSVKSIIVELHDFMKPGCTQTFYAATEGKFDLEWRNKENIFLSTKDFPICRPKG